MNLLSALLVTPILEAVYEAEKEGWANITERFNELTPKIVGFEQSHLSERGEYSVNDALDKALPLSLLLAMWKDVSAVMLVDWNRAEGKHQRFHYRPLTFQEHLTAFAVAFSVPISHPTLKARYEYVKTSFEIPHLVPYVRWSRCSRVLPFHSLSASDRSLTNLISEHDTSRC